MNKLILILLIIILVSVSFNMTKTIEKYISATNDLENAQKSLTELYQECSNYLGYIDILHKYAEMYNVPPEIILAVMKLESNFDVNADNGIDHGIMQINNVHLKQLEDKLEILELNKNIECGVELLSGLKNESEDLNFILNSYNMGEYGYEQYIARTGKVSREYSRKGIEYIRALKGR